MCGRSVCSGAPPRVVAPRRCRARCTVASATRSVSRLAELESSGGKAKPAGRSVGDVLDEWVKQNIDTWAPSTSRDQQSRVRSLKKDQIAAADQAVAASLGEIHARSPATESAAQNR